MNPLQRRLFRLQQPGMSRQPMGILASSPQMMEAARRNMNQGPLPGYAHGGLHTNNTLRNPAIYGNTSTQDMEAALDTMAATNQRPTISTVPVSSVTNPINATNASILDRTIATADPRIKSFAEDSRTMMQQNRKTVDDLLANKPTRETDIAALGGSVNEAYEDLFKAVGEDVKSFDDYKLSDYEDKALEVLGYDPSSDDPQKQGIKEAADDDKKASIWLNLMKAGLAMAAGESENTITNVAKGLAFGLEGYGEDVKAISAEEKAQNRELASIKMSLLKDDRDLDLMRRTNKIQAAQMKASLGESILAEQRAAVTADIDRQLQFANIESGIFKSVNEMGMDLAKLDQDATLKREAINATLRNAVPEEIRMLEAAGLLGRTDPNVPVDVTNPETFDMLPRGQDLFEAWFKNKGATKLTSLQHMANSAEETRVVGGIDFTHLPEDKGKAMARAAALAKGTDTISDAEQRAAREIDLARQFGGRLRGAAVLNYISTEGDFRRTTFYKTDPETNRLVKVSINNYLKEDGSLDEDRFKNEISVVEYAGIAAYDPPDDEELATPASGG